MKNRIGKMIVFCGIVATIIVTLLRVEPTWNSTDSVFGYLVVSLLILSGIGCLIYQEQWHISYLDIVLVLWYLYFLGNAYLQPQYPVARPCLRATLLLSFYFAWRIFFRLFRIKEPLVVIPLLVATLYESLFGLYQLFLGHSYHNVYPLTGTFFNPGPYATYLCVGVVVGACCIRNWSAKLTSDRYPKLYYVLFSTTLLTATALLITWSRNAIFVSALLVWILFRKSLSRNSHFLIAVCLLISVAGFYFLKQGSADGRLIIKWISVCCFMQNPIFGCGIGGFFHDYAQQSQVLSSQVPADVWLHADVLEYGFDDLLYIAVEQGATGLLFLFFFLWLLYRCCKGGILLWGITALLLTSLFSYTFELLPFELLFVWMVAYVATQHEQRRMQGTFDVPGVAVVLLLVVAVLVSLRSVNDIRKRIHGTQEYALIAGTTHRAFINDYYELYPSLQDNAQFLFQFAQLLRREHRYNDSNEMLRKGTLISNDPMFYILQGNNYQDMKYYSKAEKCYLSAFRVMPNRLYPLYRLMLLYRQSHQKGKMYDMAMRVTGFHEKIVSPATEEMKEKACEILKTRRHE